MTSEASTPRNVFLYSESSGETKVIGSSETNMTLTGADISGDYAVWFSKPGMLYEAPEGRIIWSETENGSYIVHPVLYDIATERKTPLPGISVVSGYAIWITRTLTSVGEHRGESYGLRLCKLEIFHG